MDVVGKNGGAEDERDTLVTPSSDNWLPRCLRTFDGLLYRSDFGWGQFVGVRFPRGLFVDDLLVYRHVHRTGAAEVQNCNRLRVAFRPSKIGCFEDAARETSTQRFNVVRPILLIAANNEPLGI